MKKDLEIIRQIIGERAASGLAAKYTSITELSRADMTEIQAIQGVIRAVFSVTSPRRMTREKNYGSRHAADVKPA